MKILKNLGIFAKKIIKGKADYCLALKGNQTNLHDDVRLYFENIEVEQKAVTKENGHGRIEKREYFLETDIDWLARKPVLSVKCS